jgi:hypothetical protein
VLYAYSSIVTGETALVLLQIRPHDTTTLSACWNAEVMRSCRAAVRLEVRLKYALSRRAKAGRSCVFA